MLIFREFFKTQSDENIHLNSPNCTIFSKFSMVAYAPEPLKMHQNKENHSIFKKFPGEGALEPPSSARLTVEIFGAPPS